MCVICSLFIFSSVPSSLASLDYVVRSSHPNPIRHRARLLPFGAKSEPCRDVKELEEPLFKTLFNFTSFIFAVGNVVHLYGRRHERVACLATALLAPTLAPRRAPHRPLYIAPNHRRTSSPERYPNPRLAPPRLGLPRPALPSAFFKRLIISVCVLLCTAVSD